MKILDRYIIRQFLKNYVLSFVVLVGLYVVLDMVFNFDELLDMQAQSGGLKTALAMLRDAADYYFFQSFVYFVQLSGIIPVVAASFTLMRLSHFNELSAMLSAGVPLLRVAAPMIIVAVALNFLVLADQELVIPQIIPKLTRRHDEIRESADKTAFPIRAMQDNRKAILVAGRYYPSATPPRMKGMSVVPPRDRKGVSLITAREAVWNEEQQQWDLTNGVLMREDSDTGATTRPATRAYKSNITPEEIRLYRNAEFVEMLSTRRINELLMQKDGLAHSDLVRTKHFRFTQLVANIILMLIAIGCIMTREPQQLKSAAAKCLLLCALCAAGVFISHYFAGQNPPAGLGDRWPALMAWAPIFVFGPMAVWLLDRVKT